MSFYDNEAKRYTGDGPFEPPKVIIGCWQLAGGHGELREREIQDHLRRAVELGLTSFDCADIYTGVEELLGRFLVSLRRDAPELANRVRIHTKYVPDLDSLQTLSRKDVVRIIDRSLLRLRLEELHLVQFHWWDLTIPRYVEVLSYLDELRVGGKIRHLGLTNFGVPEVQAFLDARIPLVSNQVQYSVLDRRPEAALSNLCKANGIKLLCYGTTAGGFLTDRYLAAAEPPQPFENRSLIKYRLIIDELGGWGSYQVLLRELGVIAVEEGVDIASLCQRFILTRPSVGGVIVGARNSHHLERNRRHLEAPLSKEAAERIESILRDIHSVPGEVYALERDRNGTHGRIMRYNLNDGSKAQ
jgi:aryl-alcohol dehydrogenase-like predicted oxidoreductase